VFWVQFIEVLLCIANFLKNLMVAGPKNPLTNINAESRSFATLNAEDPLRKWKLIVLLA